MALEKYGSGHLFGVFHGPESSPECQRKGRPLKQPSDHRCKDKQSAPVNALIANFYRRFLDVFQAWWEESRF